MPFDHLALRNPYGIYSPGRNTDALENALDVGPQKVLADKETARMLLGDFIGEAVAEVQAGGIKAFAHCS